MPVDNRHMMIEHRCMQWRACFVSLLVTTAAGCQEPNPRSCIDGTCTDPSLPFCDVDGALAGQPETCIAVTCTPGEFTACRGDQAITCNTEGTSYDLIQCERGCDDAGGGCRVCDPNQTVCANGKVQTCDATGAVLATEDCPLGCFEDEPRCRKLAPSNELAPYLDMTSSAPVLDLENVSFDTSTGEVRDKLTGSSIPIGSFIVSQANAPAIRVFVVDSARLRTVSIFASSVSAQGSGRAFALVSRGEVRILGPVTVFPGAGSPSAGCTAGADQLQAGTPIYAAGSGGGGNATEGGSGGAIAGVFAKAQGGAPVGNDRIVPLQGGCPDGGLRNPGGGAIQIVSGTSIVVDGKLVSRGPMGDVDAGPTVVTMWGGGAGGSILLEAPVVELTDNALIITKGGGGGSTGPSVSFNDTVAPDPGMQCNGATCSSGGNGGTLGVAAASAEDVAFQSGTNLFAGGGGGSLGRLRINSANGTFAKSSAALEIAATTTGTVATR